MRVGEYLALRILLGVLFMVPVPILGVPIFFAPILGVAGYMVPRYFVSRRQSDRIKKFNDAPQRLPFDQNCLVALCAPRTVLFTAATQDQWSNPAGQFEVLQAADAAYRFVGVEGLAAKQMPPVGELVASRLGYYIREGKHSMTPADWTVFMDYADRQWKR